LNEQKRIIAQVLHEDPMNDYHDQTGSERLSTQGAIPKVLGLGAHEVLQQTQVALARHFARVVAVQTLERLRRVIHEF
jgi:hypothetical protein